MAVTVMQVWKKLPGLNCGKCNENSCMSFAVKLLHGESKLELCEPILSPEYIAKKKELDEILSGFGKAEKTGLLIHEKLCNGCGNCVIACPVSAMADPGAMGGKGPKSRDLVFRVINGKVKIVDISRCRRSGENKSCRVCVDACPTKAIEFV